MKMSKYCKCKTEKRRNWLFTANAMSSCQFADN